MRAPVTFGAVPNMRQLQDVQVEGMALVRRPANKKRFLTKKSQEASVANNSAEQLNAPSAAITDAIDAIKLAKGESVDGHEALHTAAHMLSGRSDLTLQDLMAFGEALGLEDVAKAAKKKPMDDAEDEDGDVEAGDDVDAEDEDEEDDSKGKKMPKFLKDKLNKSQKPAAPSASEGEPMAAKGSEAREFVSKSDYEQLIERLTKSEGELADMRSREAMALEKSSNEKAYSHLSVDHEALADVTYALRKSDAKKAEALETILKSVNEQLKVAKASGHPFKPQSIRGGLAKSENLGITQFNELVDARVKANPNESRAQAITAVSKSAEGLQAYRASKGEI